MYFSDFADIDGILDISHNGICHPSNVPHLQSELLIETRLYSQQKILSKA